MESYKNIYKLCLLLQKDTELLSTAEKGDLLLSINFRNIFLPFICIYRFNNIFSDCKHSIGKY